MVLTVTVTWSGFGVELGQHVARVVGQPLGVGAFGLGREGDRAADLDDHVRHGLAHAGDQLVELGQALGALAVELAHVQVQHRGAGVVAVHRLLDLGFHRDRDVLREVGGNPLGAVRRGGDDQLVLVLGEEGAVEEVHVVSLVDVSIRKGLCKSGVRFARRLRQPLRAGADDHVGREIQDSCEELPELLVVVGGEARIAVVRERAVDLRPVLGGQMLARRGRITFDSSLMCCIWSEAKRATAAANASKPWPGSVS